MHRPALLKIAALLVSVTGAALAQQKTEFEGLQALLLANDKIELTVVPEGGAMTAIVLVEDAAKTNPLWNPIRVAREAGLTRPANFYRGHFVCVDGFGPASTEERAAGLPMHGEAHTLPWALTSYEKAGGKTTARFSVKMPLVQETLTRSYQIVDGEQIVWVDSELENQLAFDRPIFWGEHATIGAPFLEPGKVFVDMPGSRAKTRDYGTQPVATRQLRSFVDFTWPAAPTTDGQTFDVRSAPMKPNTGDHTTTLLDPTRRLVFVTALHAEKKLMIGWVFRREEFPWVQTWLQYPGPNRMARGLEFATQPFDLPRAEILRSGPMFDTPTFRILPAKARIGASFLMFYTRVPDGFVKVEDVSLGSGKLTIEDRTHAKTIALAASRSL